MRIKYTHLNGKRSKRNNKYIGNERVKLRFDICPQFERKFETKGEKRKMTSRRAPPPVPRGSPAASPDKKYVKATWDYKANEAGELSFTVGDIISVVSEDASGWWIGETNGMKGQFPVNFTEPCAAPAGILLFALYHK